MLPYTAGRPVGEGSTWPICSRPWAVPWVRWPGGRWPWRSLPGGWPWATLLVNLTGCLLIGALLAALALRDPEPSWARPFLGVGALGGYTTYSAFAVEVVDLVERGSAVLAAGYVLVSVAGGVLAVALGALGVRRVAR
ncbi:CrcB family protein [Blastococcus brunescens]|uniref:Fluoride-specific ion channel FluC n=1 Tax=Blastococcus brunescens TaxID=1564165 RepID=A0ABZ1B3T5_9ACTN|nr:CrcB family protein [Blastococcus sp. BMG 8361]WRL63715.1 CrcB family protein [Blastococcus sp. BMG 8361]